MSKKKNNLPDDDGSRDASFGLNEPTGQFAHLDEEMKARNTGDPKRPIKPLANNPEDLKFKQMGWKGIDSEEQEEELDDVLELEKKEIPEDELDMTPMVDVTFLLLIFFMVTASFTLQKSLEQPPAASNEPSTEVVEDDEILDDYIQVNIDQNNTYYVTTRDDDETECPSENEMRSRVKNAKENSSATRLIIRAHVDSFHHKVITAWDAGVVNGMEEIEIQTTDEDF